MVKKRKSVRRFKSKRPPWKDILYAIDLANQGPFAGNHNHIKYLIIEDPITIKKLASSCEQDWVENSKLLIVLCSDDTHLENLYGERGRVYSRQQAGAAAQTLMLALTNVGIDSCWVGSYSDELVREKLGIPSHIQIEAIISTGFESGKEKKPAKRPLDTSLNWEKWGQSRRSTLFEEDTDDYHPQ